jgi:hypothetical protein
MSASLDASIQKLDAVISSLELGMEHPPPLRVDPDDPHAGSINPPEGVYKVRRRTAGPQLAPPPGASA